jgi:hypothetical protein
MPPLARWPDSNIPSELDNSFAKMSLSYVSGAQVGDPSESHHQKKRHHNDTRSITSVQYQRGRPSFSLSISESLPGESLAQIDWTLSIDRLSIFTDDSSDTSQISSTYHASGVIFAESMTQEPTAISYYATFSPTFQTISLAPESQSLPVIVSDGFASSTTDISRVLHGGGRGGGSGDDKYHGDHHKGEHRSLSTVAMVGITVGSAIGLVTLAVAVFFGLRWLSRRRAEAHDNSTPSFENASVGTWLRPSSSPSNTKQSRSSTFTMSTTEIKTLRRGPTVTRLL